MGELRRWTLWLCLTFVAAGSFACGEDVEHPDDLAGTYREAASVSEQVRQIDVPVRVDGRAVTASLLDRIWHESPDASAETVIETAVQREAAAGTLLESPARIEQSLLGFARKRGMVRALLEREIEASVTKKEITAGEVDKRVEELRARVGRPEGLEVSHLLVKTENDNTERAKQLAAEIRGWLLERHGGSTDGASAGKGAGNRITVEDLFVARRTFANRVEDTDKVSLVVNPHLRFTAPDAPAWQKPSGWVDVVGPFRRTAGRLAEDGKLFRVSEPVETTFGWHLLVVEQTFPRKAPAADALRRVATDQLLVEARREAYEAKVKEWLSRTTYETHPSALENEPAGSR